MPPRIAPGRTTGPRGGGARVGARGAGARGRGRGSGAARESTRVDRPSIAASVTTVGVKRSGMGTVGRKIVVRVNAFETTTQEGYIYHYDVDITPSSLPVRMNMSLIKKLQEEVAQNIFTSPVVFDGRKNLFASRELTLGPTESSKFDVSLSASTSTGGRPPKVYQIKVTKAQVINPEILKRFIEGQQSQDNAVLTAIMAFNVVIRMAPNEKYPFNTRSFFTEDGKKILRGGLELWRGYFQSIRPSMGKMIVNLDISTGVMYRAGPLINLCLEFLGKTDPNALSPKRGLPDRERLRLQRFISGIRIVTSHDPSGRAITRVLRKLSSAGATGQKFTMREGGPISVADYFRIHARKTLKYPDLLCVEVGSGALIPLELCEVPPGQLMRKQVPSHLTKEVVDFTRMKPVERFESITKGFEVLSYGQSEYVRQFGMNVNNEMIEATARVLDPPVLKYGLGSKKTDITPANGSWNLADKKFFRPATIKKWVIVVYEGQRRFNMETAKQVATSFVSGARAVGITVEDSQPIIVWQNGQGNIGDQLREAGGRCVTTQNKEGPNLIVVVLPDGGDGIYTAVKHFGDVTMGVATQCLLASTCTRAKAQFWANVMLKVNVKLGGINSVLDMPFLIDPAQPTVIMGADVIHPAPGVEGRPSFTALVTSVDSTVSKYIATSRVQTGRQEMIDDLEAMCKEGLNKWHNYQVKYENNKQKPARLFFYRDGVSEGQFQQVLDVELPMIKKACSDLKITPKITLIVVGKRHHIRLCPNPRDADRSGNCPAGTTIDAGLGHPTEFDYYQQSHGGILGTSRPAHYSVIYDENGLGADDMQAMSFALTHVYARSTRSVSIPAPVYYADIVCSRAKNHYSPIGNLHLSESASHSEATSDLETFKQGFAPLNPKQSDVMYFM